MNAATLTLDQIVRAPYRRTLYDALLDHGKPTLRELLDLEARATDDQLTLRMMRGLA